ncbi:uncharacterized protein FFC1_11047 [Fusarium fujikuroi]|nr:uncharacterized protein FFC1_11047 [Fusarium fujikuroi]
MGFGRYTYVSSEWQDYFEKFTFRRLLIDNCQLARFFKMTMGEKAVRLSYIRYICLRIKLQDYDDTECDKPESHATINWNNQRFTHSLKVLFDVLRRWKPSSDRDTGLILEITAYLPGHNRQFLEASMDYAVHENFQLKEDLANSPSVTGFIHAKDARDQRAPGKDWLMQMNLGSSKRLHGTPLELTTGKNLKEVPIVHTLWIRHQFKRGIKSSSLARILRMALTKVTSFRLETTQDPDFSDLNNLIPQLPHNIRHLSFDIFPRTICHILSINAMSELETYLAEEALAEKARHLVSLCPPPGTNSLHLIQNLRKSQQLEHGSKLEQLCLEVPYNCRGEVLLFQRRINRLLKESAVTAWHLPNLKILEIWCHDRMNAFMFRYEHEKDQVTITWRVSEDWINLAEGSINQWRRVAQKYNVVFSVKELPVLRNPLVWGISYGNGYIDRKVVYWLLKLRDLAIDPVTLARLDMIRFLPM